MNEKLKQSLLHIAQAAHDGNLGAINKDSGSCMYHDEATGKFCAIGCLFDEKIHNDLDRYNLNQDMGIAEVMVHLENDLDFGEVFGLDEAHATTLQYWHDDYARNDFPFDEFAEILEGLVSGEYTELGTMGIFHSSYDVEKYEKHKPDNVIPSNLTRVIFGG